MSQADYLVGEFRRPLFPKIETRRFAGGAVVEGLGEVSVRSVLTRVQALQPEQLVVEFRPFLGFVFDDQLYDEEASVH